MSNDFSDLSLAENADPRCPVVLVLDSSGSMGEILPGETESALQALNTGLDTLVTELNKDPLARRRVELSVVTYGSDVTPATPFATVDKIVLPTLVASGATSTGKAVETALDALDARKKEYKAAGIEYYRPFVILISDGLPTDDMTTAVKRVQEYEEAKKLVFFAVGVEGADIDRLSQFSPARGAMKLKGVKFVEFFTWLSASQSAVSASTPGDKVSLPAPTGWTEI